METSFPRSSTISALSMVSTSRPSKRIRPETILPWGSWIIFRMERAVVVLPAPVSPTRPRVAPRVRLRFSPLTAWTVSLSA